MPPSKIFLAADKILNDVTWLVVRLVIYLSEDFDSSHLLTGEFKN